jgi:hypothetical protein
MIDCGFPVASSLIVKVPMCSEVSGGVKVTSTLQLLPGARALSHWDLTANGAEVSSPVTMTLILDFFGLVFLIVSFSGLLTLPSVVLVPKLMVVGGLNDSVPSGVEVGVAVGVAVRVAVAVGVAVAVAVLVAVAVAVGVVDPVEVAVAVAVLVAVAVAVGVDDPVEVAVAVAVLVAVAVAVAVEVAPGEPVAVAVAVAVAVFVGVAVAVAVDVAPVVPVAVAVAVAVFVGVAVDVGVEVAPVGVPVGVGSVNGVGHVLPAGLTTVRNAAVLCSELAVLKSLLRTWYPFEVTGKSVE